MISHIGDRYGKHRCGQQLENRVRFSIAIFAFDLSAFWRSWSCTFLLWIYRKRWQIKQTSLLATNRKSHLGFRLAYLLWLWLILTFKVKVTQYRLRLIIFKMVTYMANIIITIKFDVKYGLSIRGYAVPTAKLTIRIGQRKFKYCQQFWPNGSKLLN